MNEPTPRWRHLSPSGRARKAENAARTAERAERIAHAQSALAARMAASLRVRSPPKRAASATRPSKFRNFVRRAVVHEGVKKYTTKPSALRTLPYTYKTMINHMKKHRIDIPTVLYRGVPLSTTFMPNKGNYNSNGRFLSFAKQLRTARFFAGKGGTIYVLPPGKYPAFNVNAHVRKTYPYKVNPMNFGKKVVNQYAHLNANTQNYIGYGRTEDEVFFVPGKWRVGNVRPNLKNNTNNTKVFKNIKWLYPTR